MKIQNRILWVVALMYMGSFTLPAEVTPASLEQCLYKPSIGTAEKPFSVNDGDENIYTKCTKSL